MKIIVKFEQADIKKLIEEELVRNVLKYVPDSMTFEGDVQVTVLVEGSSGISTPVSPTVTPPVVVPVVPSAKLTLAAEDLEAEPDLGAILAQSNKNANNPGPYPTRPLMEGESHEWPGSPTPRGR